MRFHKTLLLIFILLWCGRLSSFTKEVRDTISSSSNDYVFVKYNIVEQNGKITISFSEVRKQLGLKYKDKYDKLNKICVIFFDRGGDYKDTFISDTGTEPLMVPSDEIRYQRSEEGYVRLDDRTVITLDLLVEQSTLSLPIYLANYEGKQRYKVFAKCGSLNIGLKKRKSLDGQSTKTTEIVKKEIPITEQVEVSSDITPTQEAELLIDKVRECLGQEELSLASLETLGRRIDRLRDLEVIIQDKSLQSKIQNVLQIYDSQIQVAKQQQNDDIKTGEIIAQQQEKEKQAKEDLAYVQERLENVKDLSENDIVELKNCSNNLRRKAHGIDNKELSQQMKETADKCDSEIKKIEESKSRRNLFMIVGGILLCILLFIGNQIFQHFRDIRNIKSMEDAQNKIAKRAEGEARRRAQSMIRSKTNRLQGQIRQTSRDAVRTGVNNVAKGIGKNAKKGISI